MKNQLAKNMQDIKRTLSMFSQKSVILIMILIFSRQFYKSIIMSYFLLG